MNDPDTAVSCRDESLQQLRARHHHTHSYEQKHMHNA